LEPVSRQEKHSLKNRPDERDRRETDREGVSLGPPACPVGALQ